MPLFRHAAPSPAAPPPATSGAALAWDDFCARMDDEAARAERYGRPLAAACLTADLLAGETLTPAERTAAATALAAALRRHDFCAVAADATFVACLPETNDDEARAAASRLRSELSLRSAATRQLKWRAAAVTREPGESAEALLQRACRSLAEA